MELEIGMYVRTDEGIFRISHINIPFDDNDYRKVLLSHNKKFSFASVECIRNLKPEPSFNIIDLIEVGDYVNGYRVIEVDYDAEEERYVRVNKAQDGLKTIYHNNDIKSIVTKEEFESMSYKVGDK